VKVAQNQGPGVGRLPGYGTLLHSYAGMWAIVLLALWGVWRWWRICLRGTRLRDICNSPSNIAIVIAATWIILLSTFYLFSHLIQPEYYRFANSLEAMLIVLAGVTMSVAPITYRRTSIGLAALAVLLVCHIAWSLGGRGGLYYIQRTDEYFSSYMRVAPVLRSIPNHDQVTIAWGDAGRLPYLSGLRHIDPIGLNTNEIAHAHSAGDVIRFIIQSRPDLIVIPLSLPNHASTHLFDSCRMALRTGDGLIGKSYPMLAARLTESSYTPLVIVPQTVYDLDVFADTLSPHYHDIIQTLVPRIGHDSDFHPAVKCIR
ncbi:MAG TPA: hypothetical protein VG537_03835, partial [Candidatus Kapabacteria bacterium]|nr:hypothetical protein [Candidatus Kapabacteria bacterium]